MKPQVQRFGAIRELTLLGSGPDCDGGVFGISGPSDGSSTRCYSGRS